jgi:hypothetical protein
MLRVGSAHALSSSSSSSSRFVTRRAHTPAEARLDVSLAIVEEVRLHVLPARWQMTREDFSKRIRAGDGGGIPIHSPPQRVLRRRRRVAAGIWLSDVPFTLRDPQCYGPAGRPRWHRSCVAGRHRREKFSIHTRILTEPVLACVGPGPAPDDTFQTSY